MENEDNNGTEEVHIEFDGYTINAIINYDFTVDSREADRDHPGWWEAKITFKEATDIAIYDEDNEEVELTEFQKKELKNALEW